MTQERALQILKSRRNVFLTGIAGAGKTFVLSQFIQWLFENEIKVGITASTGIVATALDGRTIHSFSGIGIQETVTQEHIDRVRYSQNIPKMVRAIEVLIIDEISMLSGEQLESVSKIFRAIRQNDRAFGGVQVVFCGDFLQLPPAKDKATFAFSSMAWLESKLAICYLDQAFRQKESDLLTVLNSIRNNKVSDAVKEMVNARVGAKLDTDIFTTLFTHNMDVDFFNRRELEKVKAPSHFYQMTYAGEDKLVQQLRRNCISPDLLEIKVGSKVMITRNILKEKVVNGTMAEVRNCGGSFVEVETEDGRMIELEKAKWSVLDERGNPIASIHQIPLRLAYAITIHKSQGMTLNAAVMDLSRVFTAGQGYVAFSRLRTLENLSLQNMASEDSFVVNTECLVYDKHFLEESKKLEQT